MPFTRCMRLKSTLRGFGIVVASTGPATASGLLKVWTMNEAGFAPEHEVSGVFPSIAGAASVARRARPRRLTPGAIAVAVVLFGVILVAWLTPAFGGPISITLVGDLAFGTVAGDGTSPGTVTIDPMTGNKTVGGGAYNFGGLHSRAEFEVKGTRYATFTITLPASVTLNSGGNSMTLNNFTSTPSGTGDLSTVGDLPGNGKATVYVGATLQVGTNQPAGTYSGAFTVIVNY